MEILLKGLYIVPSKNNLYAVFYSYISLLFLILNSLFSGLLAGLVIDSSDGVTHVVSYVDL